MFSISRSSCCLAPKGGTAPNLELMLLVDNQFLDPPILRGPADDLASKERRSFRERKAHASVDAPSAINANPLPRRLCDSNAERIIKAQCQQACERAQDLPLSVRCYANRQTKSGLVRWHLLLADAERLSVSGRYLLARRRLSSIIVRHGLGNSQGADLAHVQHAGGQLLCRETEGGHLQVRLARNHENRQGS